ncbi:MAG: hypothetical protein IPM56_05055 [Ignavibacteriales bacterium]|nr:MAG: hypothetical protein IPM56_05055 [Ignavibacteriales bacterium]
MQKYSPAINKGDPNILDKDGTRSDIGMYGGPLGETYNYQDLAPRPPTGLSALIDSSITVRWKKNIEADIGNYKLFRDTVINFTVDSTKLITTQLDTFYKHQSPPGNHKYYYKLTAVDNQGNESELSLELFVNITSVESELIISDYKLYQNYPNPFNPSTLISYEIKERTYVKLMVYDIKGELVSVLVNKEQTAGFYEVEFNSQRHSSASGGLSGINDLASGIYLYRIEVIGVGQIPVYSDMKKMILIK